MEFTRKSVKELIKDNSAKSYEALRSFYISVINGELFDVKVDKEGNIIKIPPTIAVRVEAAAALQRMDIDKVQGNAKSRDTDEHIEGESDILKQLASLAEKKGARK